MKRLIKAGLEYFGYEISKVHSKQNGFTINGIHYEVNPCSVGRTPEGEVAAEGAIRMIRERHLRDLKILDIGCGVGIIGLTIFSKLNKEAIVREVAFSDINTFNLDSLAKTLTRNNFGPLLVDRLRYYLSDGLNHIPQDEKFDIILGNPPHYFVKDRSEDWLSPNKLGTYDENWGFHASFYDKCHNYLTERGEVWFFENSSVTKGNDFLPFIKANANLRFVGQVPEALNPRFYWMITQRS